MNYDPNTGAPINNNVQQPVTKEKNSMAVVALILSILGFNFVSLILGIIALKKSKVLNDGKGLSIAAIIISLLEIIGIAIVFIFTIMLINAAGPEVDKNFTTTTTTTETAKNDKIEILENFVKLSEDSKSHDIHDYDEEFTAIDFEGNVRCKNVGDKISFTKDGISIEYECIEFDDDPAYGGWNTLKTTVDHVIKHTDYYSGCISTRLYKKGDFYIEADKRGCEANDLSIEIYNYLGNKLNDRIIVAENVFTDELKTNNYMISQFINDNTFYYVLLDDDSLPSVLSKEKFNVYSLDTSDKNNKPVLMGSFEGYIEDND